MIPVHSQYMCVMLAALQPSHPIAVEFLTGFVEPSDEAPVEKSDPVGIDTTPTHSKRQTPHYTALTGKPFITWEQLWTGQDRIYTGNLSMKYSRACWARS